MSTNRFGFAFNLSAKKYREGSALAFIVTAVNRVPEVTTLDFSGASIFTFTLSAGGVEFWRYSDPNSAGKSPINIQPNSVYSWDYELDPAPAVPGAAQSIVARVELHADEYFFSADQTLPT